MISKTCTLDGGGKPIQDSDKNIFQKPRLRKSNRTGSELYQIAGYVPTSLELVSTRPTFW